MKEHGLLYKADMVRAYRNTKPGIWPPEPIDPSEPFKGQTRRLVKPQPTYNKPWYELTPKPKKLLRLCNGSVCSRFKTNNAATLTCELLANPGPYGCEGDRVWIRETWCVGKPLDNKKPRELARFNEADSCLAIDYAANSRRCWAEEDRGKWRPSIHMPRWACRDTGIIKRVRVERVQDITPGDAAAEGCFPWHSEFPDVEALNQPGGNFRNAYHDLWNSIYTKPGETWADNPWEWVYDIMREEPCQQP